MADFELHAPVGANKKRKRVGRGSSSGLGTTAGKGNKGQQSRSGKAQPYVGFEGGQMPLYRRIAQRGFSNYPFKETYAVVNVSQIEEKYSDGETVNKETLLAKNLVKSKKSLIKVLGNGDITKKVTVQVEKVSKTAKEKIEKAGGSVAETAKAEKAEKKD